MSTPMPWVKLYLEILDDPKLGRLSDIQKWRFVQLILLAGECDAEGYLVAGSSPLTTSDMAWRLRLLDLNTFESDLQKIIELGIVAWNESGYFLVNFAERQGRRQQERREQWRERQKRHREKVQESDKTVSHAHVTGDKTVSHGLVTLLEEEEEEEKRIAPHPPSIREEHLQFRHELQKYFLVKTGLPVPKSGTDAQIKAAQKLWWSPLQEIAELCEWDRSKAEGLVDKTIASMTGLTISDPNSIIKTARSEYAKGNGREPTTEDELVRQGYVIHRTA